MKNRLISFLAALFLLTPLSVCTAAVEWEVRQTLDIGEEPLDVALSSSGGHVFVLTQKREILIYSPDGALLDRIAVGQTVDGIETGPRDDILILKSKKDAKVQIVTLDFIQEVRVEGSPFKGPRDARVAIAVFSDFQ